MLHSMTTRFIHVDQLETLYLCYGVKCQFRVTGATVSSQPAGHALFTARSFFLSTEREYFIQFPKIFEIFRMGKPTLNRFLRKPAYVGTLFHT